MYVALTWNSAEQIPVFTRRECTQRWHTAGLEGTVPGTALTSDTNCEFVGGVS